MAPAVTPKGGGGITAERMVVCFNGGIRSGLAQAVLGGRNLGDQELHSDVEPFAHVATQTDKSLLVY
jgi:hypothetical protein